MKTRLSLFMVVLFALSVARLSALPPVQQYNSSCPNGMCCICEESSAPGWYGYKCTQLWSVAWDTWQPVSGKLNCQAYQLPDAEAGPVGCSVSGATCTGAYPPIKNGDADDAPAVPDYASDADAIEAFMFRWDVVPQDDLMDFIADLDAIKPTPEARYEALRAKWNASVPYWQLGKGQIPYRPERSAPLSQLQASTGDNPSISSREGGPMP